MKATTMLDTLSSMLGRPSCAIPLSSCQPGRTYLLKRAGIPMTGTAMLFTVPYVMIADVDVSDRNVSLYAVPRDYHGYMALLAEDILPRMKSAYPEHTFVLFSDHSPIREVDAAARAGLGVLGQNGLLLTPDFGSFVFIGEIITDADFSTVTGGKLPSFPDEPPVCESCGACITACPVRREAAWISSCLSELTQKKGLLSETERSALASHPLVWGCDACQMICPHNQQVIREGRNTPIPYFQEARLKRMDTELLEAMSAAQFSDRAYAWRGRAVIARNCRIQEDKP